MSVVTIFYNLTLINLSYPIDAADKIMNNWTKGMEATMEWVIGSHATGDKLSMMIRPGTQTRMVVGGGTAAECPMD